MPEKIRGKLATRSDPQDLLYRSAPVILREDGTPKTFDREARSVEVIATTEEPVPVYDYDLGPVGEVLLMSGLKLGKSRQVPLQDAHDRYTVKATLGSARNIRVDGDKVLATVCFSRVSDAEDAFTKVEEGHLTDVSVGWREHKCIKLREGEKKTIGGREFTGPLRVVTSWSIKELSIVPIGADERAKARSEATSEKEKNMDPKPKALLIRLGLKADATDDEAREHLISLGLKAESTIDDVHTFLRSITTADPAPAVPGRADPAAPASQAADIVTEVRQAYAREIARVDGIRSLCDRHGAKDLEAGLITNGDSIEQASRAILEHLASTDISRQVGIPSGAISFGADARDKYRAAVVYALIKRSELHVKDLQAAPGYEEFKGYTLRELARHNLMMAGLPTGGDAMEMVGRALTAGDLPAILADVANKSLFTGFDETQETFEEWTGTMSASDFKTLRIPSITSLDDLLAITEHGEYKYGYMRDKQETAAVGTAGRIYPITRTALINDDLNAITLVFAGAGKKAKQYEGDIVYALLTANPLMTEDGLNLFVAGHNNLATVVGAPAAATLDDMDNLISNHTDANGRRLNIPLTYCILPRALFGTSESFFNTIEYVNAAGDRLNNIWGAGRLKRVYEPRLNTVPATWYGAGPKGTTVVRVHLNGVQTPYLEQKSGWTVDGVELKVRYDVGAGLVDWRGLVRNP